MSIMSRLDAERIKQQDVYHAAARALADAYARQRDAATTEQRAAAAEEVAWLEYQRDAAALCANHLDALLEEYQRAARIKKMLAEREVRT